MSTKTQERPAPRQEVQRPGHYEDHDVETDGRLIEVADIGALVQLNSAEIDRQMMFAKRFPRSIKAFKDQMRQLVTLDEMTAQSCIYALPRGGKTIEGASARFAEIAVSAWKHIRTGARIIEIGEEYITAQGAFFDLENNTAVSYEVLRRITNREGQRFDSDMIGVTGNAACSIAIRNAVLKGIPKAYWQDAYEEARRVVAGEVRTLANRRAAMIKEFAVFGIVPEQIYALLGVKGHEDISIEMMRTLAGLHTAIKEGDTSPEQAFAPENLKAPVMAPPRPRKSEFARKPAEQAAQTAKPGASPKNTTKKPAKTTPSNEKAKSNTPPAQEQRQAQATTSSPQPDIRQASSAAEAAQVFEDWYGEQKAEIEKQKSVRDVIDLQERVAKELPADRVREWNTLCEARISEVLKRK